METPSPSRPARELSPTEFASTVTAITAAFGDPTRRDIFLFAHEADAGVTVFVSTHQLSVAEEMADRIGIMHQGSLVAVGSHEELQAANQDSTLESIFLSLTNDDA